MSSNTLSQIPIFAPTQISGCQLWLDGADTTSMNLSGTSLSQWRDKSSLAMTATPTNANVFYTSSSNYNGVYINNNNNANAPGTTQLNLNSNFMNSPAYSVFATFQFTTTNGFQSIFSNSRASGAADGRIQIGETQTFDVLADGTTLRAITVSLGASRQFICVTTNSSGINFFQNGSLIGSNTTSGTTYSSDVGLFPSIGGPSISPADNRFMTGWMFEMVIYNSVLSTAQRQQVEGYLAWKWGLQSSLPSNHPYKNIPLYATTTLPPQFRNLGTIPMAPSSSPFVFGFNPVRIGNCSIWYDGADPNGNGVLPANGSSFSTWVDKSGNGKNTSSSSAPIFSASSLNGLGTLRFNGASGTGYFLTLPSFEFGTSQRTVFFVMTNTGPATGAGSEPITFWPLTGNGTNALSFDSWFRANVQGLAFGATATFVKNQYYVISYRFGSTSAYEEIYGNGTLAATNTKTVGGSSYANASSGYRLGYYQGDTNANYALDGNIGEVLIYSTALSDNQRQQVEGYLAWKWGLPSQLPSNHPFKNNPPGLNIPVVPTNRQLGNRVFQPTSFSGCQLWLDGADPNGNGSIPANGATVSTWADKSGNGYNASGGVSPTYDNNGVLFNGSSQYMTFSSSAFPSGNNPSSYFFILKPTLIGASGTARIYLTLASTANASTNPYNFYIESANNWSIFEGTNQLFFTTKPVLNQSAMLDYIYTQGVSITGYLNGTLELNQAQASMNVGTVFSFIGGRPLQTTWWYSGYISEIIVFNRALAATQRQTVEGYLAWKWGIQGNLPNNHPFKKWPPPP